MVQWDGIGVFWYAYTSLVYIMEETVYPSNLVQYCQTCLITKILLFTDPNYSQPDLNKVMYNKSFGTLLCIIVPLLHPNMGGA